MNSLLRLLVLDDDAVDRLQLTRALRSSGLVFELIEHDDASTILDTVTQTSFDCIFLDYLLPGVSGLELVRRIREAGVKTPIVIITSHGNESIAVELMKSGASDYIIKNDINGQLIGQILRNLLRIRQVEYERELAVNALRGSEARLAEAQNIARMGSWEYDIATGGIYWSKEMYKIFEVHADNFVPTLEKSFSCILEEDRQLVQDKLDGAGLGMSFNVDFRIETINGIKFTNSQGYALLDENRIARKIVGTLQDITERKLAEQEIRDAKELAENSIKVREVFLANMSHEIRTPMNAILGFTRLLYETSLSNEQKGFIDAIHFSGKNLLTVINDILDLSKLRSGKMVIENCEFNLNDLVKGVLSILRPRAMEKGLQLNLLTSASVPAKVKGDPVRLNQILTNLISNAIKFTEKGSVSLAIDASATEGKDFTIQFKVRDTGIGIAHDKQDSIFESFVQASSDTTRKYGGTGLGLTIVKTLVELQNGQLALVSSLGEGSTFTVHLPFERVEQNQQAPSNQPSAPASYAGLVGASILVAEDTAINQVLIRKVLENVGCNVDIAANGQEVLECLQHKRYDLVLMDIQMPEMDGYEATRLIRKLSDQLIAQIPIIAMTAHAFGSDVSKCIAAGMNDHISKPFEPAILYSKINKYLMKDYVKVIQISGSKNFSINLAPVYELGNGDIGFMNELILLYDQQTPAFIERLRGYLKSHNFGAIRSICHQIKSSYGILKLSELDTALETISGLFKQERPDSEIGKITDQVDIIVSLISAVTEEIKRNVRKAG